MKMSRKLALVTCIVFSLLYAAPAAAEEPAPAAGKAPGTLKIGQTDKDNKVTLEAIDADLTDLIRMLAAQAEVNLVLDPAISGRVTLSLKNVTLDEAMKTVLESNGCIAQKQGNIVRIVKSQLADGAMQSRAFQLKAISIADVQAELPQFLSDGGKLVLHAQTSSFVVIDRMEVLAAIEQFLASADVRERQVMIEAQLIEVALDKRDQFGLRWTWLDTNLHTQGITGTVTQSLLPPDAAGFQVALGNDHFTSTFQALQSHGNTNLLSSPTITTVNNKEAKVEITEELPYVQATTSIDSGSGGATTSTQTVEFVTVGVKLSVLPEIGDDNYIKMKISPEVSEAPTRFQGIPVVKKRSAETTLLVRSEQTIVLGGLIRENLTDTETRVPILSSIPLLGNLFKSKDKTLVKVELLIFIKPRIITDALAAADVKAGQMRLLDKKEEFKNPGILPKIDK